MGACRQLGALFKDVEKNNCKNCPYFEPKEDDDVQSFFSILNAILKVEEVLTNVKKEFEKAKSK